MEPRWKRGAFVTDKDGHAIQGFDAVAYFTKAQAVAGTANFEVDWAGAKWRFVSAEHRKMFHADPEKYAPQCGGYCAFAVSFSGNPSAPAAPPGLPTRWAIEDGKLYLNANRFAHVLFRLFRRGRKADETWQKLSA